jgi:hypothetical protein
MKTLVNQAYAVNVWTGKDNLWVALADGRQISVPLSYFPRLLKATEKQRKDYILSGGGTGIHWDCIDEDISVQGSLLGIGDRTKGK